jgi:serine/threonine-protein kinase RsbW
MQYDGGEASDHHATALDEASVSEVTFALSDLPVIRRVVESAAFEAGLSAGRVGEMVLAVNEVATNAVIHGRPPARLRVWKADGEIVFEVSDGGEGIADALAGDLRPPPRALSGRGLWLARLLSDAVEVGNGDGCTVSIHASAPALH